MVRVCLSLSSARIGCQQRLASAPRRVRLTASRSLVFAVAASKVSGTVKWFDSKKGYGFITPADGSPDLFVHQSSIVKDGYRSLAEGEDVEYTVETSGDGRTRAVEVTGPNGAQPMGAPPAPSAPRRQSYERSNYGGGGYSGGGGYGGGNRNAYDDDF